jgi:hypothetical protein
MLRRLCLTIALTVALAFLSTVAVFAGYYTTITVTSTTTAYENLALNLTMDIDGLVTAGYITSTGLDTRITGTDYLVLPHMLAEDRVLWVGDVQGNTNSQFLMFTQQEALDSFATITGHGGYVTIPDDAALEPGDVYAFGVMGYIDTDVGADKNIIRKDGALTFNVTAAETLTFAVASGNSLVATNVTSGFMTIMVYCDGYEMWLEINDVEQDRDTASAVPNTANDWKLFENNVMPYVSYYGQWVVP